VTGTRGDHEWDRSDVAYVLFFGLPFAVLCFLGALACHNFLFQKAIDRSYVISEAVTWSLAGIATGIYQRWAQNRARKNRETANSKS
jgi:hypothetical protein